MVCCENDSDACAAMLAVALCGFFVGMVLGLMFEPPPHEDDFAGDINALPLPLDEEEQEDEVHETVGEEEEDVMVLDERIPHHRRLPRIEAGYDTIEEGERWHRAFTHH